MQTNSTESPVQLLRDIRARLLQQQAKYRVIECERDSCKADVESLRAEYERLRATCERVQAALLHVFPYSAYRERRPDLASLNDLQLIEHFTVYGIDEGVDLSYSYLNDQQQLRDLIDEAKSKADFLEKRSLNTAAQLDILKDIVAKLLVKT